MSKYTTELRFICESLVPNYEIKSINEIIEEARQKIFDFEYPIIDESYKKILETKIIKHFYIREIGLETYGLWKLRLDSKMNEIMPFYNKLYESELYKIDPLINTDITKTSSTNGNNTKQGTTNNSTSINNTSAIINESENINTIETNNTTTGEITTNNTSSNTSSNNLNSTINSTNVTTNDTTNTTTLNDQSHHIDLNNTTYDTSETTANSDTPQGTLSNVNELAYLSSAQKHTKGGMDSIKSEGTVNNTGTDTITIDNDVNTTSQQHNTSLNTIQNNGTNNEKTTTSNEVNNSGTNTLNINNKTNSNNNTNTINETSIDETSEISQDYTENIKGINGSVSEAILKYRETFLNIDMKIINELEILFMQIW